MAQHKWRIGAYRAPAVESREATVVTPRYSGPKRSSQKALLHDALKEVITKDSQAASQEVSPPETPRLSRLNTTSSYPRTYGSTGPSTSGTEADQKSSSPRSAISVGRSWSVSTVDEDGNYVRHKVKPRRPSHKSKALTTAHSVVEKRRAHNVELRHFTDETEQQFMSRAESRTLRDRMSGSLSHEQKIYIELCMPSASVVYDVFNVQNVFTYEFAAAMQHNVVFHAGSCIVLNMYDMVLGVTSSSEPSKAVLIHKSAALFALREEILSCTGTASDSILLAMLCLTLFEKRFGNDFEYDIHKNTLAKLIATRGGLESIGAYTRSWLQQYDFFWGISNGLKSFMTTSVSRVPLLPKAPTSGTFIISVQALPVGFQRLIQAGRLSNSIIEMIFRLKDAHASAHKAMLPESDSDSKTEEVRPTHTSFWEACPSMTLPDINGEPATEKMLCLGLLLFCANFFSPIPNCNSFTVITRLELTRRLSHCIKTRSPDQEACLAWIWAITTCSYLVKRELTATGALLRDGLFRRFSALVELSEAEATFREFFFEEALIQGLKS